MANKKALVIAISKYQNPGNNLPGVANDVPVIMQILSSYGFLDVEVLRDQNATSENFKKAVEQLVYGTVAGDTCLFYYTGHGIQLPEGFAGGDDPDKRDEAFVPYEGTANSLVLDNWMAQFLKFRLPNGVTFWGIYDCCNSGELYKAVQIAGLTPNEQVKGLTFEDLVLDSFPARLSPKTIETKALILDDALPTSFHFGGAEQHKSALCMNIDGASRSVFTWAIGQVLAGAPALTVAQFEQQVASRVAEKTDKHIPQIACSGANKNKIIFA